MTYKKHTHAVADMTICCDRPDFETGVRVIYVSRSHGLDCGAADKFFSGSLVNYYQTDQSRSVTLVVVAQTTVFDTRSETVASPHSVLSRLYKWPAKPDDYFTIDSERYL